MNNNIVKPYNDGGTNVLRFRGVVEVEEDEEDNIYSVFIGNADVIASVEAVTYADMFRPLATVAIADKRFDAKNLYAYGYSRGYSEYTPASAADFGAGPHDFIEILRRYEGQTITMWIADGPWNVIDEEG